MEGIPLISAAIVAADIIHVHHRCFCVFSSQLDFLLPLSQPSSPCCIPTGKAHFSLYQIYKVAYADS